MVELSVLMRPQGLCSEARVLLTHLQSSLAHEARVLTCPH